MNRKSIRIVSAMVFAFLLITVNAVLVYADAAADWYGQKQVDYTIEVAAPDGYVNIRSGPGTDYDILTSANNGTVIDVYSEATASNGKTWGQVNYNGYYGWLSLTQVKKVSSSSSSKKQTQNETQNEAQNNSQNENSKLIQTLYQGGTGISINVIVSAPDGGVNLRYGPGTEYAIRVSMIPNNTELYVSREAYASNGKKWGFVSYNGVSGWIFLPQTTEVTRSSGSDNNTKPAESNKQENNPTPQTTNNYNITVNAEATANGNQNPDDENADNTAEQDNPDTDSDQNDENSSAGLNISASTVSFIIILMLVAGASLLATLAILLILQRRN